MAIEAIHAIRTGGIVRAKQIAKAEAASNGRRAGQRSRAFVARNGDVRLGHRPDRGVRWTRGRSDRLATTTTTSRRPSSPWIAARTSSRSAASKSPSRSRASCRVEHSARDWRVDGEIHSVRLARGGHLGEHPSRGAHASAKGAQHDPIGRNRRATKVMVRIRRLVCKVVLVGAGMAACGGKSSQRSEQSHGGTSSDAGRGFGGMALVGGAAIGGAGPSYAGGAGVWQGGAAGSCPHEPPPFVSKCPTGLPAEGCTYLYADCHDGPLNLTLRCSPAGVWAAEPGTCEYGDFCDVPSGGQLHCFENGWTLGQGGDQQTCPETRPATGQGCPLGNINYVACGYRCVNGDWTVGRCSWPYPPVWSFTPACAEDDASNSVSGASGAAGEGGRRE